MKDLKISKELISEVLNIPKESIMDIYTDGNYLLIRKTNSRVEEYNIYEFAFKSKEWLLKNNIAFTLDYFNDNSVQFNSEEYCLAIDSSSEIESIIKACNWILENNK